LVSRDVIRNCSGRVSPHGDMGDAHDEPKGSAPGRPADSGVRGRISNAQGALTLHLSVWQFQRVKQRFAAEGARGLLPPLRGRPSPRRGAARS
jgi:hypothetical protein